MRKIGKIIALILLGFGLLGLLVAKDMKSSFLLVAIVGAVLYFRLNKNPKKTRKPAPKAAVKPAAKPTAAPPAETIKKILVYPGRVDNKPLVYNYRMDVVPADGVDIVKDVLVDQEKIFPVGVEGENITILADGAKVAEIRDANRARMVGDWLREGRPVHAILLASGDKAQLRFYDDPRPRNAFREQTVVELIAYKSSAMQDVSAILSEGDRLELEEDYDKDKLFVEYHGEPIGRLPAKIEARAKDEAPWGVFVEEIKEEENDDGDTIFRPVVRIFWKNRPNET